METACHSARAALPAPVIDESTGSKIGLIAFGSTHAAVLESRSALEAAKLPVDYLRIRALPMSAQVVEFASPCPPRSSPACGPSATTMASPSRPTPSRNPYSNRRPSPHERNHQPDRPAA